MLTYAAIIARPAATFLRHLFHHLEDPIRGQLSWTCLHPVGRKCAVAFLRNNAKSSLRWHPYITIPSI